MHVSEDRTPLDWPEGWDRTPAHKRQRARHVWGFVTTRSSYLHALGELGVHWAQLSLSGTLDEPGVACYWDILGRRHAVAFDCFTQPDANIDAVTRCLEHLSALRQLGGERLLRSTLEGLQVKDLVPAWCRFYGFEEIPERSLLEKAHRGAVRKAHPDRGGTTERMREINDNMAEARAYYDKPA